MSVSLSLAFSKSYETIVLQGLYEKQWFPLVAPFPRGNRLHIISVQHSTAFLVPGTGFVEDNFPTDWGGGWGEVGGYGSGGTASDGGQQMKLRLLACRSPPAVQPGS